MGSVEVAAVAVGREGSRVCEFNERDRLEGCACGVEIGSGRDRVWSDRDGRWI